MTLPEALSAAAGGALIGAAASILLLTNGRIAGISGIVGGCIAPACPDRGWRAWFLAGLVGAGLVFALVRPAAFSSSPVPLGAVAAAGLLVGFGTRLGGGCTSGHGVCGLGRRSVRSVVATVTFMMTGAATVFVVRHLIGGAP